MLRNNPTLSTEDSSAIGTGASAAREEMLRIQITSLSIAAGVSRQSLYRWLKEGLDISSVSKINQIKNRRKGGRGRPIGCKNKKPQKTFESMLKELSVFIRQHGLKTETLTENVDPELLSALRELTSILPRNYLQEELIMRQRNPLEITA